MDPKLLIRIGGDASGFNAAMQGVGAAATRATSLVSALGTASVAGLSAVGLAAFAARTIHGIAALNDLSHTTGSSIEKLSALEDTALRTGNSFESVQTALVKFNAALKNADGKDTVSQALRAIGLSAEELKRIDPADALVLTARALDKFADGGGKARLAQELFGKSIAEVAPLLADLAEKGLGVVSVTTEQAKAAKHYNDQLAEISKHALDAHRALMSNLLPSLTATAEAFNANIKTDGTLLGALKTLGQGLAARFGFDDQSQLQKQALLTSGAITQTVKSIEDYENALKADPGNRRYAERLAELREQYTKLQAQASKTSDALKGGATAVAPLDYSDAVSRRNANGGNKPQLKFTPKTDLAPKKEPWHDPLDDADKRILDAQERYIEKSIANEERLTAERHQQLQHRLEAAGDFGLQLQAQTQDLSAQLITDGRARSEALLQIDRDRLSDQIEALDISNEARLILYDSLNANIVARQAQLTEQLKPEWQKMLEGWRDVNRLMRDTSDRFQTDFLKSSEDTFVAFVKTGKLSLKSLGDLALEYAARFAFQQSVGGLAGMAGTALSGLLGFGSGTPQAGTVTGGSGLTLPNAKGNAFENGAIAHRFASGAAFDGGRLTRGTEVFAFRDGGVTRRGERGEAGTEAIFPLTRTSSGRLGIEARTGGGAAPAGGNTYVSVRNYGQERATVEERQQGPDRLIEVIIGKVAASVRNGGAVGQAMQVQFGANPAAGITRR